MILQYKTFAEIEALLSEAIRLSNNTIREIADSTKIKPNTLYKWRSSKGHLSPAKADALLLYFQKEEPDILSLAENTLSSI